MNANTGELRDLTDNEFEKLLSNTDWEEVKKEDMTDKQKETQQVSLKDHKSVLGKKLTKTRRERRKETRKK